MDGGPPASSAAAGSVASANKSIEAGRTAVGTVDHDADEVIRKGRIERLPQRVQEALGELPGAAKEGLLALSVGVGLGVLHEMMEAELDEVVGPKGRHNLDRAAVRHGHENGEVTLGGRRVPVSRPRARSAGGRSRDRA